MQTKHDKMKIFSVKYFTFTNILRQNKQSIKHQIYLYTKNVNWATNYWL